jgi:hypothetical protein
MPEGNITPGQWLAFYDSAEAANQLGWTKEEREAIEAKLSNHHGVVVDRDAEAAGPVAELRRDRRHQGRPHLTQQVVAKIVEKVTEDGYDPAYVLAYEQQERARKSVIDAIEKIAPAATEQNGERSSLPR